jgi:hypothetical protein
MAWISADDVKSYIGGDVLDDAAATFLAEVATDALQAVLNRDISLVTNLQEYYDTNGTSYILLNHWPVRSIGAVSLNGVTINPAIPNQPGYRLDSFNSRKLELGQGKLLRGGAMAIAVTYTAGYDPDQPAGVDPGIPGTIHRALLLTAAAIFNASAADPNLTSENTGGVFSGTFTQRGAGAVPQAARDLVANEIRVAV